MLEHEIKSLVEEFLGKSGFHVGSLDIVLDMDSGSYTVSIRSDDGHRILGRTGEGLSDLNHLLRRIIETKKGADAPRVSIDINGFQKARIDHLRTVAHMMAERARFFKSAVELDPMNAYERRIVHDFVSKHADLISESTGTGRNRRVVISFKK